MKRMIMLLAVAVALAPAVALVTSNNLIDAAILAVFFPDNAHFP